MQRLRRIVTVLRLPPWAAALWAAPAAVSVALGVAAARRTTDADRFGEVPAAPSSWSATLGTRGVHVWRVGAPVAETTVPTFAMGRRGRPRPSFEWMPGTFALDGGRSTVGFGVTRGHVDRGGSTAVPVTRWSVPLYPAGLISLALLVPAARSARRHRASRRRAAGLCGSCGYDLRASPERCPECGAVPADR